MLRFFRAIANYFRLNREQRKALRKARVQAKRKICYNCAYSEKTYCVLKPAEPIEGFLCASRYPVVRYNQSCGSFRYK